MEQGLSQLFTLTTRAAHWFRERGFVNSDVKSLPVKRRELYNLQRNSKVLLKPISR
ncbi:MAG TPA: amino-acid N-acetyltransferase, partial [Chromatiales bacterium]|nr:amino-acid N-acetyltransferase [Chromatiales bacterium]